VANVRKVQPTGNGRWNVTDPASGSILSFKTQQDAITMGRDDLRRMGGGELVIFGEDGQIRSKDTVSPGRDPYPRSG
jgi:Uncharacterized protein conserved in bacteria (DUF2188)